MTEHFTLREYDPTIPQTIELVCAYVAHNSMPPRELPIFIAMVHAVIAGLGRPAVPTVTPVNIATPAEIKRSVTPDALISFEDGKSYKTLRRHLTTRGLTPEAYRAKHGLPADYLMMAASYAEKRSALTKSLWLGRPVSAEPTAA